MAKKAKDKKAAEDELNLKRELFCRYYTQNSYLFGNATQAYAAAFAYDLDSLSREGVYRTEVDDDGDEKEVLVEDSPYDRALHVCAVQSSKLLRNADIQSRITVLLNELLKDDVVDSQLSKLIMQDVELPVKIKAISEYNKLRGRIIDKTKIEVEKFAIDDLRALLAPLPKERQDNLYEIITSAIAEAELLRSGAQVAGNHPQ